MSQHHLNALNLRLFNERSRLANSTTEQERELRKVWIAQIEKEITDEVAFLGLADATAPELSDDDLLAELNV